MKMIVGLGNPGAEYEKTRHNMGFLTLERLFERMINDQLPIIKQDSSSKFQYKNKFSAEIVQFHEVLLVKPMAFMNRSGEAVAKIRDFYKIPLEHICVVHDDLDILWGKHKLQFGVGPKVHNGIYSVESKLGSKEFWRLRVGVDNRGSEDKEKMSGERYVLSRFNKEEMGQLNSFMDQILIDLKGFIDGGI